MTINSDNKDKATVIQINVSWIQSEICPPFSEAFDNDLVKYATAAPLVTDAEHAETLSFRLSFRRCKTSIESAPDNAVICIMASALS